MFIKSIITDSAGTGNFTYNFVNLPAGNHTFKVVSVGLVDSLLYLVNLDRTKTISYKYDNLGSITEINADSNFVFKYSYDTQARLKEVKSKAPNSAETVDAVYNYNSADQTTSTQVGSVGTLSYGYDLNRGWLTNINHSGNLFSETLLYNTNGNISQQTVINNPNNWQTYTYSFTYDDRNRLTDASSSVSQYSASYTYDNDGHMTTRNFSGVNNSFNRETASHRIANIIENGASKSVSYDSRGNLTYDALSSWTTYEFNRSNLPLYMNSGNKSYRFGYNEKGERITKDFEDDTTETKEKYLLDFLGRTLVVYDNNRNKEGIINGNGLVGSIAVTDSSTNYYYFLKDHLGNIKTTIDANNTITTARDFAPYGEVLREYAAEKTVDRYQYTEKERDKESRDIYFGARSLSGYFPFWKSVDPLAEKYPGVSPYSYALGNPMRFTDPDGMDTTSVHANVRYDYGENTETFTETTTDEASSSFTIVTTNTAAVNANGEVISTSKQVTYIQKEDGGELVTQMPVEQGSLSNFSSGVQTNINNAIKYRLNNDSGSWSQAFVKEYNAVRARRDNNELGFNIITTLVFPPKFSTIANSLLSIGNLGVSAYGIYGAAKDNRINPNSNLIIRIK